jgi:hypothetical protein
MSWQATSLQRYIFIYQHNREKFDRVLYKTFLTSTDTHPSPKERVDALLGVVNGAHTDADLMALTDGVAESVNRDNPDADDGTQNSETMDAAGEMFSMSMHYQACLR